MASSALRKKVRENGLSIAAFGLFAVCIVGQAIVGHHAYNEDALEHGAEALSFLGYLGSGAFVEAVFENWESEFLQMGVFVVLTKFLRQKGSSESKSLDGPDPVDEDPRGAVTPRSPWPVRRGGWILQVYERSLSLALFGLFIVSFVLHAYGGMLHHNEEARWHRGEAVSWAGYLGSWEFWEQSFQNWQSEFLSVGVLVILAIVLRERGSAQSKPVATPHDETGED